MHASRVCRSWHAASGNAVIWSMDGKDHDTLSEGGYQLTISILSHVKHDDWNGHGDGNGNENGSHNCDNGRDDSNDDNNKDDRVIWRLRRMGHNRSVSVMDKQFDGEEMRRRLHSSHILRHINHATIEWGVSHVEELEENHMNGLEIFPEIDCERVDHIRQLLHQSCHELMMFSNIHSLTLHPCLLLLPLMDHPLIASRRIHRLKLRVPIDLTSSSDAESHSAEAPHRARSSQSPRSPLLHPSSSLLPALSHCCNLTQLSFEDSYSTRFCLDNRWSCLVPVPTKYSTLLLPTPSSSSSTAQKDVPLVSLPCSSSSTASSPASLTLTAPIHTLTMSFRCTASILLHAFPLRAIPHSLSRLQQLSLSGPCLSARQLGEMCHEGGVRSGSGQLSSLRRLWCQLHAPSCDEEYATMMHDLSWVFDLPSLTHVEIMEIQRNVFAFTLYPLILACQRQWERIHESKVVHGGDDDGNQWQADEGDFLQHLQEVHIRVLDQPKKGIDGELIGRLLPPDVSSADTSTANGMTTVPNAFVYTFRSIKKTTLSIFPSGPSASILSQLFPNLTDLTLHQRQTSWIEDRALYGMEPVDVYARLSTLALKWICARDKSSGEPDRGRRMNLSKLNILEISQWPGVGRRKEPVNGAPLSDEARRLLHALPTLLPSLQQVFIGLENGTFRRQQLELMLMMDGVAPVVSLGHASTDHDQCQESMIMTHVHARAHG